MKIELGQVKVSFFPADMIALKSASQSVQELLAGL